MTPRFCAPDAVPRMTLTSPNVRTTSIQNASPFEKPARRIVRPVDRRHVHDGLEEPRRERGAAELDDDVARDPPPREVAPQRERDADRRVEVRARDLAHEQDDRHHHQPGRDDRRGAADRAGERLAHHAAAGRDEHEEERAEQLREQSPPLLRRILEVLDRLLKCRQLMAQGACQVEQSATRGAGVSLRIHVATMDRGARCDYPESAAPMPNQESGRTARKHFRE